MVSNLVLVYSGDTDRLRSVGDCRWRSAGSTALMFGEGGQLLSFQGNEVSGGGSVVDNVTVLSGQYC